MRNFFRTTWNILKPILVYYLLFCSSLIVFAVVYEAILEHQLSQGVLFDLDLKFYQVSDKYFFPISTTIAAIGIYVIYSRKMKKNNMKVFEVYRFKNIPWKKAIACFVAGMSVMFLSGVYLGIMYLLTPELIESMRMKMTNTDSVRAWSLLAFVATGFISPLIEEFIFRGIIFSELERKTSIKLTILIQGILFGLAHVYYPLIPLFSIVGVLLGLIYVWTGTIWGPILMHMGNNMYLSFLSFTPIENFLDRYDVLYLIILGFLLLAFPISIIYIYKNRVDFTYKNKTNTGQGSLSSP